MKANELMIGDWVHVKAHRGFNAQNIKVETIPDNDGDNEYGHHYGHIGAWLDGGDNDFRDVETKYLQPIQLTSEILEKNGWKYEFDKTDYMVKYDLGKEGKNCWMMWSIKEHNLEVQRQDEKLDVYNLKVSRIVIPCDYVHELQHALKLCGIEKEINNL